jgi:hypothetical protein
LIQIKLSLKPSCLWAVVWPCNPSCFVGGDISIPKCNCSCKVSGIGYRVHKICRILVLKRLWCNELYEPDVKVQARHVQNWGWNSGEKTSLVLCIFFLLPPFVSLFWFWLFDFVPSLEYFYECFVNLNMILTRKLFSGTMCLNFGININ